MDDFATFLNPYLDDFLQSRRITEDKQVEVDEDVWTHFCFFDLCLNLDYLGQKDEASEAF